MGNFARRYQAVHGRDLETDLKLRRALPPDVRFRLTQCRPPPLPPKPIGPLTQIALGFAASLFGWGAFAVTRRLVETFWR